MTEVAEETQYESTQVQKASHLRTAYNSTGPGNIKSITRNVQSQSVSPPLALNSAILNTRDVFLEGP